jgi:hypothetical protein
MFEQLLTIIAPILFCAAVGFIWARRGFDYPVDFVSRMVMNIGAPCLILASFNEAGIDPGLLGKVAAATLAVLLIMMGFGAILVRLLRLRMTTFLPSVVFANIGNMGLPLCYFAFGETGLALGLTVFLVVFTLQMSVGLVLASGHVNVLELLKQPVLWATAAAVAMILGDWALPGWLANTVTLLGDITIPLMLITLGVSLASLRVEEWRHSLLFSLVRVAGGFCAGWLVAEWFGLQGVERGVLILQSSMPVAVFNYLLALRYKREPGEVAGMVLLSTLLAFLSLPLVVAYVLL